MQSGILIASESIGDGRWFVERAAAVCVGAGGVCRPIGTNQGVQFPIAQAQRRLEAARSTAVEGGVALRSQRALWRRSQHGQAAGQQAAWDAANAAWIRTVGTASPRSSTVERKFRETRLYAGRADQQQPGVCVVGSTYWGCAVVTEPRLPLKRVKPSR